MVGTQLPSFTIAVERGKIREFALAIGDPNPVYTDPAAARSEGYRDVLAPPTFLTALDQWGSLPFHERCKALQVDPVQVLHGEQAYEYHGLIYAGDVITGHTRVVSVASKRGSAGSLTLVVMETTYVNQGGETVAVGRNTWIERG